MIIFPYSTARVLTDDIFMAYGGHTERTTDAQRKACYLIAEMAATGDLGTLLANSRVTGTYLYAPEINLDYSHVTKVILTRFIDFDEDIYYVVTGTANEYIALKDAEYGIVDINAWYSHYCTNNSWQSPYQVQIVYEAGLTSGTSYQPNILLALTTLADITLNEVIGYGNEAPGDAGIQSFSNQQYSENRRNLIVTSLGSSPRANFAYGLLNKAGIKRHRYVGLGIPYR